MINSTLISQLASLIGQANVLHGHETEKWQSDWTGQYHSTPLAVVRPATTNEVASILNFANTHGLPVVPISGNTGLSGGTACNNSLVLSLERMNRIRSLSPSTRIAVVEAGVIVGELDNAARQHDLMFPLSFGGTGSALIGGVLSTNAGGSNVVHYGSTRDLCLGLEAVMPDGRILDLMQALPKNNSGFDLKDLFIGAEGQIGVITAATFKLYPHPKTYATALVAIDDPGIAPALLNALQDASDGAVIAYEYMCEKFVQHYHSLHPEEKRIFDFSSPCILIELASSSCTSLSKILQDVLAGAMEDDMVRDAIIAQSETQRKNLWLLREAAAEISFHKHPVVDTDIAVPLDQVATYLRLIPSRMKKLDSHYTDIAVAHLGDGNIHYTVWPSRDDESLLQAMRIAIDDQAVALGGTFSAEHGIGLCKLQSMEKHKNCVALEIMRSIKNALDPNNILNPGKTIPE
ncbi:FAD-binding oxidoreductase [Acetobacter tropicalis]|uniref:FAD-binding oxidoreductase n=1 Tax=Acetobacter tropicalis TaxID=104102 RepID=UPI0039763A5E